MKGMKNESDKTKNQWLVLGEHESIFDKEFGEYPAQYAKADETPSKPWDKVKTKLSDINTSKLH